MILVSIFFIVSILFISLQSEAHMLTQIALIGCYDGLTIIPENMCAKGIFQIEYLITEVLAQFKVSTPHLLLEIKQN